MTIVICPHAVEMECDDECSHAELHEHNQHCAGICDWRKQQGLTTFICKEAKT